MNVDFDRKIDRGRDSGSFSSKWMDVEENFPGYAVSGEDVLPMWVADMDFLCPEAVRRAVQKRAEHGIYGYVSEESVRAFKVAVGEWFDRRYHWRTKTEWMTYIPAVVPAINVVIQECSEPGDGVIIQPPVYRPFMAGIMNNRRSICRNALIENNGYYRMDYEGLERLARQKENKVLILCSTHNPVGRVWSQEELPRLS